MDASLTQGVLLTAQLARMQSRLCLLGRYNLHGYGEKPNARESGCDCVLEPRKDENGTCNRQASYVTKIEKKQETSEFSAVMTTYLRPWSSNDRRSHDLPAFRSFRPVTSVRSHPQLRLRLHLSSLSGRSQGCHTSPVFADVIRSQRQSSRNHANCTCVRSSMDTLVGFFACCVACVLPRRIFGTLHAYALVGTSATPTQTESCDT